MNGKFQTHDRSDLVHGWRPPSPMGLGSGSHLLLVQSLRCHGRGCARSELRQEGQNSLVLSNMISLRDTHKEVAYVQSRMDSAPNLRVVLDPLPTASPSAGAAGYTSNTAGSPLLSSFLGLPS
jgi:hypothetical protein